MNIGGKFLVRLVFFTHNVHLRNLKIDNKVAIMKKDTVSLKIFSIIRKVIMRI